jgi:hypothetical protein
MADKKPPTNVLKLIARALISKEGKANPQVTIGRRMRLRRSDDRKGK